MSGDFRSWLAPIFCRFVALKRASGYEFRSGEGSLRRFDTYLDENVPAAPLTRQAIVDYLESLDKLSPRGRDNQISVVWQALIFARRHGARIDPLPGRPRCAPSSFRIRPVRIVSQEEIASIITAARSLEPSHHLRSATYATLFGLLYATGVRISEALSIDVGDIDWNAGLLTIRHGKFGKTRVLPLKSSVVEALDKYLTDPRRKVGRAATNPVFVSNRNRRLSSCAAMGSLKKLCIIASIKKPFPRLHDFRHSFAVSCVMRWYRKEKDVNALLPALCTYLGHVSVEHTRIYLQANGILLEEASRRFSLKSSQLDEVLS